MQQTCGSMVLCFDEFELFGQKHIAMCGRKLALNLALNTPSPVTNMVVTASCFKTTSIQQGQGRRSELMGKWLQLKTKAIFEENLLVSLQKTKMVF